MASAIVTRPCPRANSTICKGSSTGGCGDPRALFESSCAIIVCHFYAHLHPFSATLARMARAGHLQACSAEQTNRWPMPRILQAEPRHAGKKHDDHCHRAIQPSRRRRARLVAPHRGWLFAWGYQFLPRRSPGCQPAVGSTERIRGGSRGRNHGLRRGGGRDWRHGCRFGARRR